jgi:hypothetical protein
MGHDALADFTALAIILDQAEVSVITGLGLSKEHRGFYYTTIVPISMLQSQEKNALTR